MTPHLHPRSRLTSSLFGATLAVSFLVVAMPHILPCPAPRVRFADSEFEILENGQKRKIRQQGPGTTGVDANSILPVQRTASVVSKDEEIVLRKAAHECPVPKPRGIFGQLLGFKSSEATQSASRAGVQSIEFRDGIERPRR